MPTTLSDAAAVAEALREYLSARLGTEVRFAEAPDYAERVQRYFWQRTRIGSRYAVSHVLCIRAVVQCMHPHKEVQP